MMETEEGRRHLQALLFSGKGDIDVSKDPRVKGRYDLINSIGTEGYKARTAAGDLAGADTFVTDFINKHYGEGNPEDEMTGGV